MFRIPIRSYEQAEALLASLRIDVPNSYKELWGAKFALLKFVASWFRIPIRSYEAVFWLSTGAQDWVPNSYKELWDKGTELKAKGHESSEFL